MEHRLAHPINGIIYVIMYFRCTLFLFYFSSLHLLKRCWWIAQITVHIFTLCFLTSISVFKISQWGHIFVFRCLTKCGKWYKLYHTIHRFHCFKFWWSRYMSPSLVFCEILNKLETIWRSCSTLIYIYIYIYIFHSQSIQCYF